MTVSRPALRVKPVTSATPPVTLIEPTRGWRALDVRELWAYRELLGFLIWRDVKVRYKQTLLGAAWAVIQPFTTMIVFTLFFGRLAQIPSDGVPYPLFAFCALVPWQFFAGGLTNGANSLVQSASVITKVYFPRLLVPTAAVVGGLVDLAIAGVVLLGLMLVLGYLPTVHALWLPLLLLQALITALGAAFWLSALNVRYRDIRYTVPFLVQVWLFATPIAYPSSLLAEHWQLVYALNPMVGVVEGCRWSLLGTDTAPGALIGVSAAVAVALLVTGALYFKRVEAGFADVV